LCHRNTTHKSRSERAGDDNNLQQYQRTIRADDDYNLQQYQRTKTEIAGDDNNFNLQQYQRTKTAKEQVTITTSTYNNINVP
jgi:hypothetical protein